MPTAPTASKPRAKAARKTAARKPAKAKELQTLFDHWNASMKPPRWEDRRWDGDEDRKANKKRNKSDI